MKIRETKTVDIIFEDYELPEATLLREWYKKQGYVIAQEFIEVPKGEQGYIVLALDTVFKQKRQNK